MAPVILGYWDIRGLGMPIRLLLEYAGVEYVDKLYTWAGPPDFSRAHWFNEKFTLGLDFPNLPYLIDGDVKLTQSHVIMRYLARKHSLAGSTEREIQRADLAATQALDFHMDYVKIVYDPEFLSLKDNYAKTVPDKMKLISNFLGTNKFVAGDEVTYADFILFEYLEGQLFFDKDVFKNFPVLAEYHKRVLGLEAVDRYFKSPKAIKYPFTGTRAFCGGLYSEQLCKGLIKVPASWD